MMPLTEIPHPGTLLLLNTLTTALTMDRSMWVTFEDQSMVTMVAHDRSRRVYELLVLSSEFGLVWIDEWEYHRVD